jgi:hypothetical protein
VVREGGIDIAREIVRRADLVLIGPAMSRFAVKTRASGITLTSETRVKLSVSESGCRA